MCRVGKGWAGCSVVARGGRIDKDRHERNITSTTTNNTTSQSAAHFQRGMTALMEFAKVGMKKNKVRLCVFEC